MSLNFRLLNWKNNYKSRSALSFLYVLTPSGNRGIRLSFRIPSEKRSNYRSEKPSGQFLGLIVMSH
jgi:hypothetical protein